MHVRLYVSRYSVRQGVGRFWGAANTQPVCVLWLGPFHLQIRDFRRCTSAPTNGFKTRMGNCACYAEALLLSDRRISRA